MPTSFCSDHYNGLPLLYSLLRAVTALYSYAIVNEWLELYIARFWISTKVGYWQCCLVVMWLGTHETAAFSVNILCSSVQRFIWSHICRVHVCLAVTCHWHLWQIWQDDRDHLWCVGWVGGGVGGVTGNKSCHRMLTLEKNILLLLLPGLKPATSSSDHETGTVPQSYPCFPWELIGGMCSFLSLTVIQMNVIGLIWFYLPFPVVSEHHHYFFWRFLFTNSLLCCCGLACGAYMAVPPQAFYVSGILWHSDGLELLRWLTGSPETSVNRLSYRLDFFRSWCLRHWDNWEVLLLVFWL